MLINLKSLSPVLACYDKQHVCNHFYTERAHSSKITTFRGFPFLTPMHAGFLKLRESGLGLLKSMFDAEKFMCKLSGFISSHFGAIHS